MKNTIKLKPSLLSGKLNVFVFLLASLILSSCLKNGNKDNQPQLQSALNVVNASPGSLAFNFSLSKQRVQGAPLEYTMETGYFITFPGIRDFEIIPSANETISFKTTFDLKKETYHTLFVAGENSTLTSLFTEDDLSDPPAGKAKIRFVNLVSDSGEQTLGLKNQADIFTKKPFKSVTEFTTIDPGTYDLQLKTSTGSVLTEKNVAVAAGKIYTVWSKGLVSGAGGSPVGLQFRSIN